jgi:hypothetical protein
MRPSRRTRGHTKVDSGLLNLLEMFANYANQLYSRVVQGQFECPLWVKSGRSIVRETVKNVLQAGDNLLIGLAPISASFTTQVLNCFGRQLLPKLPT